MDRKRVGQEEGWAGIGLGREWVGQGMGWAGNGLGRKRVRGVRTMFKWTRKKEE